MLNGLCEQLGLDRVDLVANDTGGAIAQVFAAHYPQTNPHVHADQL